MQPIDQQEFAELFREAYPRLWTVASAILGDHTLAEDTVQESAITGLRIRGDFQRGTNFTAWMSQVVRFKALNQRKTTNNRKTSSLDVNYVDVVEHAATGLQQQAVTSCGELTPDQEAFDDQVAQAIRDLDPQRRACLLLRAVHGLSYEEIAELVELPAGTAMSHVHRAKAAMRKSLSDHSTQMPAMPKGGRDA